MELIFWILAVAVSLWIFEKFSNAVSMRTFCLVGAGAVLLFFFGEGTDRRVAAWVILIFFLRYMWEVYRSAWRRGGGDTSRGDSDSGGDGGG